MAKGQETKKQHFVPECYLKQFMVHEHLYTLDIKAVLKGYSVQARMNYPGRICYLEDFYTISKNFPIGTFAFEQYDKLYVENTILQQIEKEYPNLLIDLTNNTMIAVDIAQRLADFIVNLKLRNPYHLEGTLEKNKEEWIDKLVDQIVREKMPNSRYADMPEWSKQYAAELVKQTSKENPHFSKQMLLFSLIQRASDKDSAKKLQLALLSNPWTLLIAPDNGPYFVTTDCPGFATDLQENVYGIKLQGGFAFHLPLSSHYCLLVSDLLSIPSEPSQHVKKIGKVVLDERGVYQVNDRQIRIHNKLLIASDQYYLNEIARLNKPGKIN